MGAQPKETLEEMLRHLGFNATVEEQKMDEGCLLDVQTDDSGRLIGRKGQTLIALQYILNRFLFQQDLDAPKVTIGKALAIAFSSVCPANDFMTTRTAAIVSPFLSCSGSVTRAEFFSLP